MTNHELARLLIAAANALMQADSPTRSAASGTKTKATKRPFRWVAERGIPGPIPKFVREMTGAATKYEIITKYGTGSVFVFGEPLPPEV